MDQSSLQTPKSKQISIDYQTQQSYQISNPFPILITSRRPFRLISRLIARPTSPNILNPSSPVTEQVLAHFNPSQSTTNPQLTKPKSLTQSSHHQPLPISTSLPTNKNDTILASGVSHSSPTLPKSLSSPKIPISPSSPKPLATIQKSPKSREVDRARKKGQEINREAQLNALDKIMNFHSRRSVRGDSSKLAPLPPIKTEKPKLPQSSPSNKYDSNPLQNPSVPSTSIQQQNSQSNLLFAPASNTNNILSKTVNQIKPDSNTSVKTDTTKGKQQQSGKSSNTKIASDPTVSTSPFPSFPTMQPSIIKEPFSTPVQPPVQKKLTGLSRLTSVSQAAQIPIDDDIASDDSMEDHVPGPTHHFDKQADRKSNNASGSYSATVAKIPERAQSHTYLAPSSQNAFTSDKIEHKAKSAQAPSTPQKNPVRAPNGSSSDTAHVSSIKEAPRPKTSPNVKLPKASPSSANGKQQQEKSSKISIYSSENAGNKGSLQDKITPQPSKSFASDINKVSPPSSSTKRVAKDVSVDITSVAGGNKMSLSKPLKSNEKGSHAVVKQAPSAKLPKSAEASVKQQGPKRSNTVASTAKKSISVDPAKVQNSDVTSMKVKSPILQKKDISLKQSQHSTVSPARLQFESEAEHTTEIQDIHMDDVPLAQYSKKARTSDKSDQKSRNQITAVTKGTVGKAKGIVRDEKILMVGTVKGQSTKANGEAKSSDPNRGAAKVSAKTILPLVALVARTIRAHCASRRLSSRKEIFAQRRRLIQLLVAQTHRTNLANASDSMDMTKTRVTTALPALPAPPALPTPSTQPAPSTPPVLAHDTPPPTKKRKTESQSSRLHKSVPKIQPRNVVPSEVNKSTQSRRQSLPIAPKQSSRDKERRHSLDAPARRPVTVDDIKKFIGYFNFWNSCRARGEECMASILSWSDTRIRLVCETLQEQNSGNLGISDKELLHHLVELHVLSPTLLDVWHSAQEDLVKLATDNSGSKNERFKNAKDKLNSLRNLLTWPNLLADQLGEAWTRLKGSQQSHYSRKFEFCEKVEEFMIINKGERGGYVQVLRSFKKSIPNNSSSDRRPLKDDREKLADAVQLNVRKIAKIMTECWTWISNEKKKREKARNAANSSSPSGALPGSSSSRFLSQHARHRDAHPGGFRGVSIPRRDQGRETHMDDGDDIIESIMRNEREIGQRRDGPLNTRGTSNEEPEVMEVTKRQTPSSTTRPSPRTTGRSSTNIGNRQPRGPFDNAADVHRMLSRSIETLTKRPPGDRVGEGVLCNAPEAEDQDSQGMRRRRKAGPSLRFNDCVIADEFPSKLDRQSIETLFSDGYDLLGGDSPVQDMAVTERSSQLTRGAVFTFYGYLRAYISNLKARAQGQRTEINFVQMTYTPSATKWLTRTLCRDINTRRIGAPPDGNREMERDSANGGGSNGANGSNRDRSNDRPSKYREGENRSYLMGETNEASSSKQDRSRTSGGYRENISRGHQHNGSSSLNTGQYERGARSSGSYRDNTGRSYSHDGSNNVNSSNYEHYHDSRGRP